ncbi:unnamed protein product, partial [Polarella glacialis]
LKAKPELNGQSVTIQERDPGTGRWRCKVAPFGEEIKVKADNLGKPADEGEGSKDGKWLRRGVLAVVVTGDSPLADQIVRVVTLDEGSGGKCRCVVRASGEQVTVSRSELRPMAGAAAAAEEQPQAAPQPQPATTGAPRSDWRAAELERRRLAEGFRAGFEEGATVLLQALKGAPELNGKQGKLLKFNSQSLRWQVEVDGITKSLSPSNLVPVISGSGAGKRSKDEGPNGIQAEAADAQEAADTDESASKRQRVEE